jgi:hypothetical protein
MKKGEIYGKFGHVDGRRNAYRTLVGKPQQMTLIGRTRRKWVDNIDTDLKEIRWVVVHWININRCSDKQGRGVVNNVTSAAVLVKYKELFTG